MSTIILKPSKRPVWKKILIAVLIIALIVGGSIGLYAYDNLSWQTRLMDHVWQAGFVEKQATLPNGTVLAYGEGGVPDGVPLFLIHGQQVAWEDYSRVLPQLAQSYHIYAVDCHGHGNSSHDPARYSCSAMTEDFIWFIQNVIGKPCLLSGHSSGGVLATNIAATAPEYALGLLIEDAPFHCFRPEEMKANNAFVWSDGFLLSHNFLNQSEEKSYYAYYFENASIWKLFGEGMVKKLADDGRAYTASGVDAPFSLWYMPASMMNSLYYNNRYDLLFGEAFYDDSWFSGLNEDAMLQAVQCPTVYLHAKESHMMDGVMTCATSDETARQVSLLIPKCTKVELPYSDHDIHYVHPKDFLDGLEQLNQLI
ncbi:MAG: alpha/beta hydrolase [Eubacteriales bacterium]|nr:alpha/beta hydrolase [Eubacteriales bacterium]